MAQEHLNSLLTNSGLDQADIDELIGLPTSAADAKPEDIALTQTKIDSILGKVKTSFETQVKNDPKFWETLDENNVNETFKKKIEAQQYGRATNIVRQKTLKAFGLSEDDFTELPAEEKNKLETFITRAAEKYASSKAGDKQLQADLVEARKKLETLEAAIPEREGVIKTEAETRFNSEKLDFIILAELASFADLKAPAQYLVGKIAAELKAENAFAFNGLTAKPMQKDKPTLEVLEGSKVLTLKDLIEKKLKADGLIGEPKKEAKKTGTVDIDPDDEGGLAISSHILEKIKANQTA